MENYIKGHFKRSIFNGDNGYTVALLRVKEASKGNEESINHTITFTGYFPPFNEMDEYILYGEFVKHDKYGSQYSATHYEVAMPTSQNGLVTFLSSGMFKGIGEKKAEKIANVLGENAIKIILDNPSNLALIPGITQKNIDTLYSKLKEYAGSYDVIVDLTGMGFSNKDAMLIYKRYEEMTKEVLADDIYKLVTDINELSFPKIDLIARRNGMEDDDDRRIRAALIYVITTLTDISGNCFFTKEELTTYLKRVVAKTFSTEKIDNALQNLILTGRIIERCGFYYIREMFDAESVIASRITYLNNQEDKPIPHLDRYIKEFESANDITYNDDQKKAITSALTKSFCIITGGPGTGKTTILKAVVGILKDIYQNERKLSNDLVLLAPTGRASKRMSEASNFPASTIHRFLKWNKDLDKFAINEYNKSESKIVIIDESSMLDAYLFHHLLQGLFPDTKIILVGDYHQLPSVGPGQVLKDIIESDLTEVCYLKELYRQGKNSHIISLAYEIQESHIEDELFNEGDDLTYIKANPSMVMESLKELCAVYIDMDYKKFQVLAPMYKGINGIDRLNIILQEIFNPKDIHKKELVMGDITYREQDKVIQLMNYPDENVYNGDIGMIERIENGNQKAIYINFDGNVVKYTPTNFSYFKHGFAISIHKSQGSEFDVVVLPVVASYGKMLYQKLMYTAVTRAKKNLYIIGDLPALKMASLNTNNEDRRSSLKEFIENKYSSNTNG